MFYKFKNINYSLKKFKFFFYNVLNLSNYFFELLIYFNYFFNKSSFILKKIFLYILNDLNNKSIYIFKIRIIKYNICKGKIIKKLNYRSKGNLDIMKKKYFSFFIFLNYV